MPSSTLRKNHQVLLDDSVRMDAYRAAIKKLVRPGDRVADLGCGTGILAELALDAGALHVDAIEVDTATAAMARKTLAPDILAGRVTLHEALAQTWRPKQSINVLLTETMGSFGFDENILSLLRAVRRHPQTRSARVAPRALTLSLVPVELRNTKRTVAPQVVHAPRATWLAEPHQSARVDLLTVRSPNIITRCKFKCQQSGMVTGFAGWFDAELAPSIRFTTHPDATDTHWHQGFVRLREPVKIARGQTLALTFGIGPDPALLQSVIEFDFSLS